jgi:hypothetical protein
MADIARTNHQALLLLVAVLAAVLAAQMLVALEPEQVDKAATAEIRH